MCEAAQRAMRPPPPRSHLPRRTRQPGGGAGAAGGGQGSATPLKPGPPPGWSASGCGTALTPACTTLE
jgi:hypothetical protein